MLAALFLMGGAGNLWAQFQSGGSQRAGEPEILARTIVHLNGNYTESVRDNTTRILTLETYKGKENPTDQELLDPDSAHRELIERQLVKLDQYGRGVETLVYGPDENLKYRGKLVYNGFGQFQEEQLYNTTGELIRRRIQEYGPGGKPLALKTVSYVEGIPDDFNGVLLPEITQDQNLIRQAQEENQAMQASGAGSGEKEKEKGRFFGKLQSLFGDKDKEKKRKN